MRRSYGLIRQQQRSSGAQIRIRRTQRGLIIRCEVIGQRERSISQFKETVTKILAARVRIEGAISGDDEHVAAGIGRRATATLPDSSQTPVWGGIEDPK